jgi:mono/diheme cytochrome c family protein
LSRGSCDEARSPKRAGRGLAAGLGLLVLVAASGCWEQVDGGKWFPQMKRQAAVQAFEDNGYAGLGQGLTPPDGTVALGNPYPDMAQLPFEQQEALANPVPATLVSLKNGEMLFQRYCVTCHGPQGYGDGPVAGAPFGKGPFGLVFPVGGPNSMAPSFSDGHIYTTISLGRNRMPSYKRIPPQERWDIVNFIRDLNRQGGRP